MSTNYPTPDEIAAAEAAVEGANEAANAALRQLGELRRSLEHKRELARQGRRPAMPGVRLSSDVPTIITFTRRLSGKDYRYAAVGFRRGPRCEAVWATTGREQTNYTWNALLGFIGPDNWGSIEVVAKLAPVATVADQRSSPFRPQEFRAPTDKRVSAFAEAARDRPYHYGVDADGAVSGPYSEGGVIPISDWRGMKNSRAQLRRNGLDI